MQQNLKTCVQIIQITNRNYICGHSNIVFEPTKAARKGQDKTAPRLAHPFEVSSTAAADDVQNAPWDGLAMSFGMSSSVKNEPIKGLETVIKLMPVSTADVSGCLFPSKTGARTQVFHELEQRPRAVAFAVDDEVMKPKFLAPCSGTSALAQTQAKLHRIGRPESFLES